MRVESDSCFLKCLMVLALKCNVPGTLHEVENLINQNLFSHNRNVTKHEGANKG